MKPTPFEAISKITAQGIEQAVANGANSVSMPDELVEIAIWLDEMSQLDIGRATELLDITEKAERERIELLENTLVTAHAAIIAMMHEFRLHDLPYGSEAYALAKDARIDIAKVLNV